MSSDFVKAVDKAVVMGNKEPRRGHLGASAIGARCARQTWYGFRWVYEVKHTGRILRLFNRGHEEEPRFARWLRLAGVEVRDYAQRLVLNEDIDEYRCESWDTAQWVDLGYTDVSEDPHHIAIAASLDAGPKQWSFSDHGGHFCGSSDGMVRGELLNEKFGVTGWGGLECKTHSDKSFKLLEKSGVVSSKPIHFIQMQIYMHYFKLPWCLYLAVNKNDDSLYTEVIHYREDIAKLMIDNALKIILSGSKPGRITEDPSWYECRFCDFREICFYDKPVQKNCRSCTYAQPVEGGQWYCNKFGQTIPKDFIPTGCDSWESVK